MSEDKLIYFSSVFSFTVSGRLPPLCAFVGGFASQEVIKALTNKYLPVKQLFYTDCLEVVPEMPSEAD